MTNGERLAFYRKKNALTQQQLGEQLNVSAQAVSKWENDQSEPDIATLCKLAEIYQVSVNELVGAPAPQAQEEVPQENTTVVAPVVVPVVVSAPQKPKKPNPVAKFLKKFWWLFVVVAVLAVAAIVFINVWNAFEPDRMLEKFNQVDLGMTREEVEAIMGEPDALVNEEKAEKSDGIWGDYTQWKQYGYSNRDYEYWYYRDAQFEKTQDATEQANKDLDFGYEPEPWTQIRFVFDDDGVLIEAYYNAEFSGGYKTAYGETEKEVVEAYALEETPYFVYSREGDAYQIYVTYDDGSIFMGTLPTTKKNSQKGEGQTRSVVAQTCWGDAHIYLKTIPVGTYQPEDDDAHRGEVF